MKTADLTGPLLAYWVARACNFKNPGIEERGCYYEVGEGMDTAFDPHSDWSDCGPLTVLHKITYWFYDHGVGPWHARKSLDAEHFQECLEDAGIQSGPTPLIAVCRAVVASVFGEEVDDEK